MLQRQCDKTRLLAPIAAAHVPGAGRICAIYPDGGCYGPPCPWSPRHYNVGAHLAQTCHSIRATAHAHTKTYFICCKCIHGSSLRQGRYSRPFITPENVRHRHRSLLLVALIFTSVSAVFRHIRNSGVV